jgi:hypothetical protein
VSANFQRTYIVVAIGVPSTSSGQALRLRRQEHAASAQDDNLIKRKYKEHEMNFLSKLLQGISFVPAIVSGVEGLFGHKSGADKKNTALTLVQNTIQATDAIAGKDIVDPGKFQDGLGKVIDGVVQCLNSSVWAKTKSSCQ